MRFLFIHPLPSLTVNEARSTEKLHPLRADQAASGALHQLAHRTPESGPGPSPAGTEIVLNLTNKYALYNFLSTFSGTHYVSPRSYTAELGLHF
jgi:hypothetical protein